MMTKENKFQHYWTTAERELIDIEAPVAGQLRKLKSATGIFSPRKVDLGTSVLLEYLIKVAAVATLPRNDSDCKIASNYPVTEGATPSERRGIKNILDLGCGWGIIGYTLATMFPENKVFATDINPTCEELVRINSKSLGLTNLQVLENDEQKFDEIWSNPPIKIGKKQTIELLETYQNRLTATGKMYLVIQKHLGAESIMKHFGGEKLKSKKGYWVISVS
jgi:16S rRNA G1207 methylase RsmC